MLRRPTSVLDFPITPSDKVEVCCAAALRLEELGEYEQACEALARFWKGPGARPAVDKLPASVGAELLLRAGSLTAWLGSKRQIEGWQEKAKDLLSEAAARFDLLRDVNGWGHAQKSLALCYWREGALSEARVIVMAALGRIPDSRFQIPEVGIALHLVLAMIERCEGRNAEALGIHVSLAPVIDRMSELTQGNHHNGLANSFENLGRLDEAIVASTAAAYHYEQCDCNRGRVLALNSLANLQRQMRNFDSAHVELDTALNLARAIGDELHVAHLKDTRALVLLDEGRIAEAEKSARASVALFERGDETAYLVRSLRTLARAQSRNQKSEVRSQALMTYVRAYVLAGDRLGSQSASEVGMEMIRECAGEMFIGSHVTLDQARDEFEAAIIKRALDDTDGNITAAALRLGHSQQALDYILKKRLQNLQPLRNRKQSVIGRPRKEDKKVTHRQHGA